MRFLIHIVYDDYVVVNKDAKQQTYVNETVSKAVRAAAAMIGVSATAWQWSLSEFKSQTGFKTLNLKTTPAIGVQIEGQSKVVLLLGYRTYTELLNYFTNVFRTGVVAAESNTTDRGGSDSTTTGKDGKPRNTNGTGTGDGNGTGDGFGFGVRDCNALDTFLDSLGFGKIKQIAYLGAAAYFGFRATGSNNKVNQLANGAAAAGLLYMGLKNPSCTPKK